MGVHYPHYGALIVGSMVARSGLKQMLVDNGSTNNIIFRTAIDKMVEDHKPPYTTSPTTTSS